MLYCSSNGQVLSVPVAGGDIQQVTALPVAVQSFKVFLDARTCQWWLLASLGVFPSKSPAETAAADAAADATCRCFTSTLDIHLLPLLLASSWLIPPAAVLCTILSWWVLASRASLLPRSSTSTPVTANHLPRARSCVGDDLRRHVTPFSCSALGHNGPLRQAQPPFPASS